MTSPPSSLHSIPPPIPVDTHPNRVPGSQSPDREEQGQPDPNRLAPEDAYFAPSLSRAQSAPANYDDSLRSLNGNGTAPVGNVAGLRPPRGVLGVDPNRKDVRKLRGPGGRRRRKGAWKKLLWVKQSYPDNYTDTETFLDHLQRNPRVRPYDFWPLVSDSTVIVQHVCSVVIFVCCFVGIVQDRVSPVSIVCWGSVGTVMGWILWDNWVWKEQAYPLMTAHDNVGGDDGSSSGSLTSAAVPPGNDAQPNGTKASTIHGLGLTMAGNDSKENLPCREPDFSGKSDETADSAAQTSVPSASAAGIVDNADTPMPQDTNRSSLFSSRNRQRLSTVKSAFLIYFSLLGLSPILKSLTKSTASDSIWAMSCWLLIMNIFSFDYGSGEGAGATNFPASLSTNAAVMASTVLASRLPSTTHVFSLMLFSMEIFGLFPIFRRQLRQKSWTGHVLLTLALVIVAGGAVGVTLSGGWAAAIIGSVLGSILTALAMGGCSWWLISLQKYKNVVIGPWDPARPIIRRHWN
ncbi:Phosphatidylinositol N-acetylglucosaminyltransferase [Penicillium alfredii]|uniref:Phosphatidylinositol N-acetylglucosaminyltransferase n=1 Tax=Penicillium alfredii TaxID=1506179 RepID=A0A9W9KR45_9EURO|nr:Phosphatidylinositol N-acetylglucosaminyltransferase [Penicillium alfredii]KAJ5114796.1 Phosphatidylinositol N-acetylglucosaminyltransferase [Penicillium alfredii]